MPFAPHTRLGPYEVITLLGSGGMGEVYRARDTRLGRDVALKVLLSDSIAGEEERRRFEHEARTVSKLAHPNICPLFDVGREGDTQYLVMELIEGQTLAARLNRGRLPMDAVLRHGAEIAAALAAAHAAGVVHRDLKPGNVMLTPNGAKLLDFGLARAFAHPSNDTLAATRDASVAFTAAGTVVGTVPYMAPEQIRGSTDAQTDIFALGAVMFEMATGVRAFAGSTEASAMSAVLTHDPPAVSALEPASPPAFDRLVRRCLAKDPAARWRSAADLEIQLRELASGSGGSALPSAAARRGSSRRRIPWILAGAATLVAALWLAFAARRPAPETAPIAARFRVWPAPGTTFAIHVENDFLAVAPDGRQVAYIARDSLGRTGVWTRALDELEARPVGGTTGARSAFWSPDGRSIGFVAAGRMQRVTLGGGSATPICEVPRSFGVHASWGRSGEILFSTSEAIYRVAENGGKPAQVVSADTALGDFLPTMPNFLPDGKRFLFDMVHTDGTGSIMYVAPGEKPREIMKAVSRVDFTEPDLLLYVEDGTLFSRRFDWKRGRVLGGALPVADTVGYFFSNGWSSYATSPSGTLVFHSASDQLALRWVDRAGRALGEVAGLGRYLDLRLGPDGDRLLFSRALPELGTFDVWLYDVARGTETRLTSSNNSDFGALWLPGGREILHSARGSRRPQLVRLDLETARSQALTGPGGFQMANDVSPDGRTLVYWEGSNDGEAQLWSLALNGGTPARVFPQGGGEDGVRFSPDGRWIAFLSAETGNTEAYVTAFPGPGRRIRLSTQGARAIRWPRASNEILYLDDRRRIVSVPTGNGPGLELGTPRVLFTTPGDWGDFDVTADGRRILAMELRTRSGELPLTVVTAWPRSLRR